MSEHETDYDPGGLVARYCPDPLPYSQSPMPDWLDELDLKVAPPHVRMGTHGLDLNDWFVFDEHRERELALRSQLVTEQRPLVFECLPSAEDAARETWRLVQSWLAEHGHANQHELHREGEQGQHPLAIAGQLVQDDLCLMVHRNGDWHLDAAMLCFPSVWRLAEKIGRPTAEVHGPVRHYAHELSGKVDLFFNRIAPDKPVWRRNFSIKATNALYLPYDGARLGAPTPPISDDGSPYWIRSERQTLRRLPESGAILFTIRTQLAPLGVLRQRRDRAKDLLATYRSWETPDAGETATTRTVVDKSHVAERGGATPVLSWLQKLAE